MVNFNGTIQSTSQNQLTFDNRGFKFGDALFETIRVINGKVIFAEEHYLRLMASMRILRMEIPMSFTLEFFEAEILKLIEAQQLSKLAVRVRFNVYRNDGGLYTPSTNDVSYYIEVKRLKNPFYTIDDAAYEVDLYKDFYSAPGLLSSLKTNNKSLQVVGSIFASENDLQNCLLLNTSKNVVEALNGNIFLLKKNVIKTPPILDGCINGIARKQLLKILKNLEGYTLEETSISPFELQKADELFITNTVIGIQPITKYRKKTYTTDFAKSLVGKLNAAARLS
ncbi:branched-chain amino acid aminotransferase [Pustulibacterium marinum]|uniref:branched-chain-amino-acid transaminase n=1 Tax=Pustulibacterium marinum TaxID=1224947 RepID=A0A1I7HZJ2_9FLAO|nr:aminotransferase class IV [Pustulibacterium marinum]SFU66123.1 branched-chain amino acid aminotransferase [Pustulibacterium marinum]